MQTPVLRHGFHAHPRAGACLVEFAAALPGGVWTDRPPQTHPVLARLARRINDASTEDGRIGLLPWAAWLVDTRGEGDDELARSIAVLAGAAALRQADQGAAGRIATLMSGLAWPAPQPCGPVRSWHRRRAQRRMLHRLLCESVRTVAGSEHADAALRAVLGDAVNLARARSGLPAVVVDVNGCRGWAPTQVMRVELRIPDGAESAYYQCTALPDRWPAQLAQAWAQRVDELRQPPPPNLMAPSRAAVLLDQSFVSSVDDIIGRQFS